MFKGKKIVITGGEGMIGSELRDILHDLDYDDIYILDLKNGDDARDYETCIDYFTGADYVFHLAGIKGNPKMSKENPVDFMGPMLRFNTNCILAAHECKVPNFLYTSSIAVEFPDFDKYPAWAKMTGEMLIEAMRIQYPNGTKYCIVRPANVYGKYDDFENNIRAMVVTSLINKAMKDKYIEVWGDGGTIRDFIHAKDVALGMIKCMEEMPQFPVRLCSGQDVTIKQLAEIISKETGKPIKYVPLENQVMGEDRRVMVRNWDNPLSMSLENGIKEVIDHVKAERMAA